MHEGGLGLPQECAVEQIERAHVLEAMLSGLSLRQRRLIKLRYYEGWTLAQIAREYKVTKPTITVMHRRILVRLRKLLSENGIRSYHL